MVPRKSNPQVLADGRTLQYCTIKARLYPDEAQAELFEKTFDCCRYIWNRMLTDERRFYLETGAHFIPTPAKYKKEAPFLKEVDNQALTQEYNKLAQAFRVFFKNPEAFGYPNFKRKKTDRDSFTACSHDFAAGPTIYITRDGLRLTKAGIVKAKFPRRPRGGWKLRRVTVRKTKSGKYFASILYEYTVKQPEPVTPDGDAALNVTYSDLTAPYWLRRSQEKLAGMYAQLKRMQRGSNRYCETLRKFRELHEHVANQRKDFIHKQTSRIANDWDVVCVTESAEAEAPAGSGMFRECLRYKLARRGKTLILAESSPQTTRASA